VEEAPFDAFVKQLRKGGTVVAASRSEGTVTVASLESVELPEPLELDVPEAEVAAAISMLSDDDRENLWPDASPQMAGIYYILVGLQETVQTAEPVPRRASLRNGRFVVTR
jgi:hypothetical protein